MVVNITMDEKKRINTKSANGISKISMAASVISLALVPLLFMRIEFVYKKTEAMETKLENRIQGIEDVLQAKVQKIVQATLLSYEIPSAKRTKEQNDVVFGFQSKADRISDDDHHHRQKRDVPQSSATDKLTLQQIRQEINNKLNKVCNNTNKICLTGPPGPQGAHGYPGYKGEKGVPGKIGPRGPLGPVGAPGASGIQGPMGPQGVKGQKGDNGSVGAPGLKGDTGPIGRPGEKGFIGLKGSKGIKGSIGIRGPKGQLVVSPRVNVFPESQIVVVNKPATFYCWVDGHTSTKTTWRKLGGTGVINGDTLYIKDVQKPHAGSYLCSVFTGYGVFRTVSTLRIKEPPMFTEKPPSQVRVQLGSTLKLCCEAEGSVSWSRAQSSLKLLPAFQQNGCLTIISVTKDVAGKYICRAVNNFGFAESTTAVSVTAGTSCDTWSKGYGVMRNGEHFLAVKGQLFKAYCGDMGWTLIARFSNFDQKNWVADEGNWWYDLGVAFGKTTDPAVNADMISPAFWLVSGKEFKITRSDDPSHTPLLQTTGNCLAGQTFRSKLTSYGDFRNGKGWATKQCLGSCTVQYGGRYKSTDGFQQAECSGDIQSANKIGFWCHSGVQGGGGDGSVMMFGGGGGSCSRADHGIGITEADSASFVEKGSGETEYDFGYDGHSNKAPSQSYSLNLWIR